MITFLARDCSMWTVGLHVVLIIASMHKCFLLCLPRAQKQMTLKKLFPRQLLIDSVCKGPCLLIHHYPAPPHLLPSHPHWSTPLMMGP